MKRRGIYVIIGLLTTACLATSETTTSTTSSGLEATTTTTTQKVPATTTTVPATVTTDSAEPDYDIGLDGGTEENPEVAVDGPERFTFNLGDTVLIRVLSSVSGELHVHGYDLFFELVAGEITEVVFPADVPGIFEAELEESHILVFELEISA